MVSVLFQRSEVYLLWYSFVSFPINFERKHVQLEDRHLGHWNLGLWTVLSRQPFQNKEKIRPVKNCYLRLRHENWVSGITQLHHFHFKKGPQQKARCSNNQAAWIHQKVQRPGHLLINMFIGLQKGSQYVQILHQMNHQNHKFYYLYVFFF